MTSTGRKSARNCQDGRYRFASMKLIICLERLFNRMRIEYSLDSKWIVKVTDMLKNVLIVVDDIEKSMSL